eukprot:PhM_4_TR16371/c0_g1_i1/m.77377/K15281/SLC35D; solute carrier family 35
MFNLNSSEKAASASQKLFAAGFYGVSSLAIMFVNKFVLTTYGFPSFSFLALVQFIATLFVLKVQHLCGKIELAPFRLSLFKDVFPLPLLFLCNTLTGLGATKTINMPMFVLLRRFSIVMTLYLESYLLGKVHERLVHISVSLMILGAMIAAANDFTIDIWGYTFILLNDVFTALNGVLLRKKVDVRDKLTTEGVMFYNTLFSTPFLVLVMALSPSHEFSRIAAFPGWGNPRFIVCLVLSGVMGFILNFSYYLCTTVNSPLTTTVVGCLKNVLSTYCGMLIRTSSGVPEYHYTPLNFVGLNISVFGSLLYSSVEYSRVRRSTVQKAAAAPSCASVEQSGHGGPPAPNSVAIDLEAHKQEKQDRTST